MTDVVFLRDDTDFDVFALFPAHSGAVDCIDIAVCYEHVGQHGQAHIDYCLNCVEVTDPAEYVDLREELELVGYDDLNVVALDSIDSAEYSEARRIDCGR